MYSRTLYTHIYIYIYIYKYTCIHVTISVSSCTSWDIFKPTNKRYISFTHCRSSGYKKCRTLKGKKMKKTIMKKLLPEKREIEPLELFRTSSSEELRQNPQPFHLRFRKRIISRENFEFLSLAHSREILNHFRSYLLFFLFSFPLFEPDVPL